MKRILCYGDSNTYGHSAELYSQPNWTTTRYDEQTRYPKVLQALLGTEYEVIEEGCGGRTTAYNRGKDTYLNGLPYLYPCINSHCPLDLVIIMLGTNDLADGIDQDANAAAIGMRKLVSEVHRWGNEQKRPCPKVLIISPPLYSLTLDMQLNVTLQPKVEESKKFRQLYQGVAEENGCYFMACEDYASVSELDGTHLTAEGHRNLGRAVYQKLKESL